jgi:hypothetical protein
MRGSQEENDYTGKSGRVYEDEISDFRIADCRAFSGALSGRLAGSLPE